MNVDFTPPGYTFILMKPEAPTEEHVVFIFNNLTFKPAQIS